MAFEARLSLGTPETRRKGRSTLKALSAFMSKPPPFSMGTPAILLMVSRANVKRLWEQIFEQSETQGLIVNIVFFQA